MPANRRTVSILIAAILLVVATPLFANTSSNEPPDLFGETLDVRVVNLEIVVEQGGERVHGLSADDFVLEVDGESVPIEFFTEVRGGSAVASATASGEATVPALQPGDPVGTRYLIFIDDVFTVAPYRNRVLRQLKKDLAFLQPEDTMAIVSFNGDTVDLLTSWTGSIRELEVTLRRAEQRPSHGLRYRGRESYDDFYGFADRRFYRYGPGGYGFSRAGERAYAEVGEVVDAAASTLRAFARADGRKVMLMLSGNWPPTLPSVGSAEGPVQYATSGRATARVFAPLVDAANRLGYTLYPIDVPGVETRFADASVGSIRDANRFRRRSRDREWARETGFLDLASRTGGEALLDGAATAALRRVHDDTRSYYSIGFTPNWQANDQRHRVDVDVPGLRRARIRQRTSFSDLSAQTEATLRLESAQLFDLPVPSAGTLAVQVGTAEDAGWNKVVVPLAVEIPLDQVTHLPTAEGWATRLELRFAVTDDRGDRADIPMVPLVFQSAAEPTEGATETYVARLKMRERPHRVLVSVVDPATGEELSTRLEVDPML